MTRAGLGSTRVELFEAIRRDARRENASVRELARRYSVHRRTVRQALASASPPARKVPVRKAPRLDPVKPLIDAMLREDLTAPRKQRHTARRILARLVDEHGHADLKYPTVRDYVARRRAEIALEAGNPAAEAMVPQSHEPGAEAEVDFAELYVDLAGRRTKVFLFTLRLSYSGRAVHRVFASQGQEAFLEGHIHAFERLGGVPWERIRYDNLKAAVSRVLFGRDREESARGGCAGTGRPRPPPRPSRGRPRPPGGSRTRRRRRLRHRGHHAAPAAGRDVRARPAAHPAGGSARAGHGAPSPLLGAGPADRTPGAGPAAGLGGDRARRAPRDRPPRSCRGQGGGGARARSLPRGPGPQAWRAARLHGAGPGPRLRGV